MSVRSKLWVSGLAALSVVVALSSSSLADAAAAGSLSVTNSAQSAVAGKPGRAPKPNGDASAQAVALAQAAKSGHRVAVSGEVTPRAITYANPTGTLTTEVTQTPARVRDAAGRWVAINPTLVEARGRLVPKSSAAEVSLSATGAGALATLSPSAGTSLSLGFGNVVGSPTTVGAAARYPVIGQSDTQLDLSTGDSGFAAHVILSKAPEVAPTYAFPLQLRGLSASLTGQQLRLPNATGDLVATSAPLRMWDSRTDAAGDPAQLVPVAASLVTRNGVPTLLLKPAMKYLTAADTKYPVTIDPDVSSVKGYNDTYLTSGAPTTDVSKSYLAPVGSQTGSSKLRSVERFYIDRFMGKNIVSANLSMFQWYAKSCASGKINVYPTASATKAVTAATTWNTQPAPITGARWATSLNNNASTVCTNVRRTFDVTRMINGYTTEALASTFTDATGDNSDKQHIATIELQAASEVDLNQDQRFCSMEASSAPAGHACLVNPNVLPTLSVTYTSDLGDKSTYSTTDHPLNDRTTLKINNDNGNALVKANDVKIAGLGPALSLTRYYNALSSDPNLSLGPKWSLSLGPDVKLVRPGGDASRFDYYDPTGKLYAGFTRKSDITTDAAYKQFTSPVGGIGSDLVDNGNGTYTLTAHSSQQQMTFAQVDTSKNAWVLTKMVDRSGNTLTVNYPTGSTQMSSITDASGHTVSFTWSGGRITTIADANGSPARTWTYDYIAGRLTTYTDPANQITDYGWTNDADPRVASIEDPANASAARPRVNLTTTAGQVTSVRYLADPAGNTVGFDFSYATTAASRCTTSSDTGNEGKFDYSTNVTSTDATKGPVSYCFRERGDTGSQKTHRVIDGLGNKQSKSFTIDDQPSTFTNSGGAASGSTVATYGPGAMQDQLQKVTSPTDAGSTKGSSTALGYATPAATKGHDYLPSAVYDSDGYCKSYKYDDNSGTSGADVGLLTDTYLSAVAACSGSTTGKHYQQAYNSDGTLAWSTTPAATAGVVADRTSYTYWQPGDAGFVAGTKGQVKTVVKPGGSCATGSRKLCTSYTYDALARTSSVTDGRGKVTTYDYDLFDRAIAVHVDGDTACGTGNGTCVRYFYDAAGNLRKRDQATGASGFKYDRLNRQIEVQDSGGALINYGYNDDGKLTQLDVLVPGSSNRRWNYEYDAANQPSGVTGGPGGRIDLGHDDDNKPSLVKFPTTATVSETRDYTKAKRPKSITVTKAGASTDVLPDWTYSYAKSGADSNKLQKATVAHASNTTVNQAISYTYSDLAMLTKADADTGLDYAYAYSDNADLVSEKTDTNGAGATTTHYGFDKAGQLCWQGATDGADVTTGCSGTTPSGDTTFTQDAAGNSLGTASTPFTYNSFSQVSAIGSQPQQYDDLGNDLRAVTGTTTGSGTGARLTSTSVGVVARTTSAGTTFYTRDPSGKILAEDGPAAGSPDPDVYYYLTNYQGTVVGLLDTSGDLAAWYRYSPYGDVTIINGTSTTAGAANPWRYVGGYYDIEGDGYTQFKARYYDNHGHWTQPDPKTGSFSDPATLNSYGYAGDNPINNSDVSGTSFLDFFGKLSDAYDFYKVAKDIARGDAADAFNDIVGPVVGLAFTTACTLATAEATLGGSVPVCIVSGAAVGAAAGELAENKDFGGNFYNHAD